MCRHFALAVRSGPSSSTCRARAAYVPEVVYHFYFDFGSEEGRGCAPTGATVLVDSEVRLVRHHESMLCRD